MTLRVLWLTTIAVLASGTLLAAERHIMPPRVPADQLQEARVLGSPLATSPDVVEQGRLIYAGKGGCVNCHGPEGQGDGILAATLDPSPRNFHHRGFWRHRTEGEIFWVIKHGSPGTAMVGMDGVLTDEDIWSVIQYLRHLAGEAPDGETRRGRGRHGGGPGGMGSSMERPMGSGDGECCGRR